MKKITSIVLALVMALSVFSVMAFAEDSDIVYKVISEEEKTCEVTGAKAGVVDLVIPATVDGYTVVAIGNRAFEKNPEIATVEIPDTVETIGQFAFTKTALYKNDANWENGVLYIGKFLIIAKTSIEGEYAVKEGTTVMADAAFRNCKKLTKVTLPEGMEKVSLLAFRDCEALTEVVLPTTVKNIEAYAFVGCTALETVVLPENVEYIGNYAFNNSGITEISIPANVKGIGKYAFCHCEDLTAISVAEGNEAYSSASGILYNKDKSTIVYVPNKADLTNFAIPETVKTIGAGAFEGAIIEELVIPEGVTAIEAGAFEGCGNLKKITIPATVTAIDDTAFGGCEKVQITAEKGSVAYEFAEKNDLLPKILYGDVNGDGEVTSLDARWALQAVAMLRDLDEEQFVRADVNKDGVLASIDARWILQIVAGTREVK